MTMPHSIPIAAFILVASLWATTFAVCLDYRKRWLDQQRIAREAVAPFSGFLHHDATSLALMHVAVEGHTVRVTFLMPVTFDASCEVPAGTFSNPIITPSGSRAVWARLDDL